MDIFFYKYIRLVDVKYMSDGVFTHCLSFTDILFKHWMITELSEMNCTVEDLGEEKSASSAALCYHNSFL